jgi:hypothetical protein
VGDDDEFVDALICFASRTIFKPTDTKNKMGLKDVMRDAPSHRQTLRSHKAPDGTRRYGFWSPELKEERKTFVKFALLVRPTPHHLDGQETTCKTD